RGSEVAGCPAAIAGCGLEELGGPGGERCPVSQPGGQRCAEHCEPGVGCRSGCPVCGRCNQREDQPHVQAVDLEVKGGSASKRRADARRFSLPCLCLFYWLKVACGALSGQPFYRVSSRGPGSGPGPLIHVLSDKEWVRKVSSGLRLNPRSHRRRRPRAAAARPA